MKILIINRGGIASHVIHTCEGLDIETVAVYSEADVNSLHMKEATESYCIRKPPVAPSYLNIDEIIDAAKKSGAEVINKNVLQPSTFLLCKLLF